MLDDTNEISAEDTEPADVTEPYVSYYDVNMCVDFVDICICFILRLRYNTKPNQTNVIVFP